jgi:hypothetical protein
MSLPVIVLVVGRGAGRATALAANPTVVTLSEARTATTVLRATDMGDSRRVNRRQPTSVRSTSVCELPPLADRPSERMAFAVNHGTLGLH